ncbi:MAG: glycogen debranching N-terminal domain-containing protein [Deltaproteobacteria bacterium]|nr:glycogen debranching N-terminal domain-containing protein [Deltaproteobacteria bacterium]
MSEPDDDVIRVADKFYILATSSLQEDRAHVLKEGESFALFDRRGDLRSLGASPLGLYVGDTRFLSRFSMLIDGQRPLLLSSTVHSGGGVLVVDLTNADIRRNNLLAVPHGALHLGRTILLQDGALRERVSVTNYGVADVDVTLTFDLEADYADVFEVRGHRRERRGERLPITSARLGQITFGYKGVDGITRRTCVTSTPPIEPIGTRLQFALTIPPRAARTVQVTARCEQRTEPLRERRKRSRLRRDRCRITSSSSRLEGWLDRSQEDLRMMLTRTPHGVYPYAGVPWFSTAFGRDGIITALQTLWFDPSIAHGVLEFLAATQARDVDVARDAQPGKIVHEVRSGELANIGEVPFGRYYGTVDATPLFVVLAGAHLETTGDRKFAERLWPHVRAAVEWLDRYGDVDGDGFIEYTSSSHALRHQGWKDSQDSVFHVDGTQAESPIALCEVQGYAYAARRAAAMLARQFGETSFADEQDRLAEALRVRFESAFWSDELGCYGLALDRDKRLCGVRTSNAGHTLWSGIASVEHARTIATRLLDDDSFSGWGVRTVARGESRYNPMSYHNGSVWPHDNAIIAAGLARYGHKHEVVRIFSALFDVTRHVDLQRLPELFCGFPRGGGTGPTLYPVACSPQAWASGASFMLLASCLGLSIDGNAQRVSLAWPKLPHLIRELHIDGLRVGPNGSVDLTVHRYAGSVGVDVRSRVGDVEVVIIK